MKLRLIITAFCGTSAIFCVPSDPTKGLEFKNLPAATLDIKINPGDQGTSVRSGATGVSVNHGPVSTGFSVGPDRSGTGIKTTVGTGFSMGDTSLRFNTSFGSDGQGFGGFGASLDHKFGW